MKLKGGELQMLIIGGGLLAVGLTLLVVTGVMISKFLVSKAEEIQVTQEVNNPSALAMVDSFRSELEDEIKGLTLRIDAIVSLCGKDSAYFRGEIEGLRAELNAIKSAPPPKLPDLKVQPLQVAPLKFETLRVNHVHYDQRQLKKRPVVKKKVVDQK